MIDYHMRGLVALVTGSAGNLGRALCSALAFSGCDLALLHSGTSSAAAATQLADSLASRHGIRAHAFSCDLRDEDASAEAVRGIVADFGSIGVVVNNAGLFTVGEQQHLAERDWDLVMDTNAKGIWRMCRLVRPYLEQTKGCIVNICSINAFHPGFGGTAHYDASKGAVAAYTRSLAKELAPWGIRVNAVAPGLIDSPILRESNPDLVDAWCRRSALHRLVSPAEVAALVAFLASGEASAVTGEIYACDCGYVMM